jgi:hypothetical protein
VGASAPEIKGLSDRLRAVPARKPRREGGEIALVPSLAVAAGANHEEEDEPEE